MVLGQNTGRTDCTSHASIPKLPVEIWLHIAEWLDERDINSLCQSSRGLHRALIWYLYTRNCRSGHTALLWAAKNATLPLMKALLSMPCIDINAKDHTNQTSLSLATQYGHTAAVDLLLTSPRVDVNILDSYNRSPLCHAAQNGFEPIVDALLKVPDIDVNSGILYEDTPLYLSIANGHEAIAMKLLNGTNLGPVEGAGLAPSVQAALLNRNMVLNKILEIRNVDSEFNNYKLPNVARKTHRRKSHGLLRS